MINTSKKCVMVAITLASLSFGAIADHLTQPGTAHKEIRKLGGGFISGMSPEQTCLYFLENYKSKYRRNYLCKAVDRKDFTNMTIVNGGITNAKHRIQDIRTIAFFFDKDSQLSRVMSVERVEDMAHFRRSSLGVPSNQIGNFGPNPSP